MNSVQISFKQWRNGALTLRGTAHAAAPAGGAWVVFSHGFTSHRIGPDYLYVNLSRALASRGISSLRFDFAGAGESDGAFDAMTVSSMAGDLCSALDEVRASYAPGTLVAFGHSLGGCVAALITKQAPLDGLALLAPVADPLSHVSQYRSCIERGTNKRGLYEIGPHEMSYGFVEDLQYAKPLATVADHYRGPLFLATCENDEQIAAAESDGYRGLAQNAAITVTHHVLAGADHRVSSVAARAQLANAFIDWMKERCLCA